MFRALKHMPWMAVWKRTLLAKAWRRLLWSTRLEHCSMFTCLVAIKIRLFQHASTAWWIGSIEYKRVALIQQAGRPHWISRRLFTGVIKRKIQSNGGDDYTVSSSSSWLIADKDLHLGSIRVLSIHCAMPLPTIQQSYSGATCAFDRRLWRNVW